MQSSPFSRNRPDKRSGRFSAHAHGIAKTTSSERKARVLEGVYRDAAGCFGVFFFACLQRPDKHAVKVCGCGARKDCRACNGAQPASAPHHRGGGSYYPLIIRRAWRECSHIGEDNATPGCGSNRARTAVTNEEIWYLKIYRTMKHLIIKTIRAYQAVSRSLGTGPLLFGGFSGCRSWPTCSEYALNVIERDGTLKGTAKALVRAVRCNPLWPQRNG